MASLFEYADGLKRIEFNIEKNAPRQLIRLGSLNKESARQVLGHVERLIAAKAANVSLDTSTARWLAELDDTLHSRIAATGLIPPREKTQGYTLAQLLERFTATHQVKASTAIAYRHVRRNLADYFGADKVLNDITELDADSFKAWLRQHERLSTATTNRRTVAAKTIFKLARRWGMIQTNPFDGVRGGGSENESRKRFITRQDVAKVLEACPNVQWRVLVALSRFGGLRIPSEALPLTWGDVDWDKGTLHVTSPKTEHHAGQASRTVPLFPELRTVLVQAYEQAEPGGSPYIITRYRTGEANLRPHFMRIIRRAGLEPWPKPWHNMRASRQSELMAEYSLSTACRWLGNSPTVAARHYAMSVDQDADFQNAIGPGAVKGAVADTGIGAPGCATVLANPSIPSDIRGKAHSCTLEHIDKLGVEGLEPPTLRV